MLTVPAPMDALIPHRNSSLSFSADSPPVYGHPALPVPAHPNTGCSNNQGLAGLTAAASRKHLYTLTQSASVHDEETDRSKRRWARLFKYTEHGGKHVDEDA